jgi:hypothetical protein
MQGTGGEYGLFQRALMDENDGNPFAQYGYAMWRSPVYQIGKPFDILEIVLTHFKGVPDGFFGRTIVPKIYIDNSNIVAVGNDINGGNYEYYPDWNADAETIQLALGPKNFDRNLEGTCNFFLQLEFFGGGLKVVKLPITIDLEVHEQ